MDDMVLYKLYARLTRRQQQVLWLACQDLSAKEMGQRLGIATSVVSGHLTTLYEELGALEPFAHTHPNRYTLMLAFVPFFGRHPDLGEDAADV